MQWAIPRMVTVPTSKLAAFIQQARERNGWTMRELEDRTGISKTALQMMTEGKTKVPLLENLDKLAQALGVPLAHLIELCGFNLGIAAPPRDPATALTPAELEFFGSLTPDQRAAIFELAQRMLGRTP